MLKCNTSVPYVTIVYDLCVAQFLEAGSNRGLILINHSNYQQLSSQYESS